jgi:shikimate dehydrogenase
VKFALIGDPIEHSLSPQLHRGFLEAAGVDGSYIAVRVTRGHAAEAMSRLRGDGFSGCNVTFPLKEEAMHACDDLTDEARRARAVNTVFFGNRTLGTNTDGIGARSAIEALFDEPIALARVGVLGYGATARAILTELHDNDVYAFVWGRDAERTRAICAEYEASPWPVQNVPEIVVSTLPPDAELPSDLVAHLLEPDLVMDANYGVRSTLGRRIGRDVVGGGLMLEAQARASFDFWLAHIGEIGTL